MESDLLYNFDPEFRYNYCGDQLAVFKNIGFYWDPAFRRGYDRAVQAVGNDWGIHWRFHTCLWAAQNVLRIEGSFVECGVGRGFMTSGIMEVLNWNEVGRHFYLFDTYVGLVEELCTDDELKELGHLGGVEAHNKLCGMFYAESYESVKRNFAEWTNVTLVKGAIPETLDDVDIRQVAYLHIDMNAVIPEMAAIEFFWPKMPAGAVVVLDDYAMPFYGLQYDAWNAWAEENGVPIFTVPTGQGLIVKT